MKHKFKIGDRVCYNYHHDNNDDMTGTVIDFDIDGDPCVRWDDDPDFFLPKAHYHSELIYAGWHDFQNKIKDRECHE